LKKLASKSVKRDRLAVACASKSGGGIPGIMALSSMYEPEKSANPSKVRELASTERPGEGVTVVTAELAVTLSTDNSLGTLWVMH
jgi:hypothetical protein